MKLKQIFPISLLLCILLEPALPPAAPTRANAAPTTDPRVIEVMRRVNAKWQRDHPDPGDNQWGRAVYHIGNLATYATTGDAQALAYTQRWAEQNQWQLRGGCSTVFADNQAAGQVYLALDALAPDPQHRACLTQSIQQSMTWAWAEVDLGAVQSISQIKLYPLSDRAYRYYVQVKSTVDAPYTTIVNRASNTESGPELDDNVTPTEARFVRFWFIGAYGYVENWVSIQEIALFGPDAPDVNLALSKSVTCSSQPEPQNPCTNLVDGDLSSRWSADFPLGHTEGSMNWWWIDALFMAMPVYAKLNHLTNDATYTDVMTARYHDTKVERKLYDATEGLWYRDDTYLYPGVQTPSGQKVFWSRGNGWVFAALTRTLDELAATDPQRAEYEATFQAMAAALKKRQNSLGYWNASLNDASHFPGPEASGTAFFTYGLAWGINHGLLARADYETTVGKAWGWLINDAVHPDGLLGYIQPIGGEPAAAGYNDTSDYGVGAFLLAGHEVNILAPPYAEIHRSYLPLIQTPQTEEKLLFQLESPCQFDRFFTTNPKQTVAVTPSCTLTDSLVFETPGALQFAKTGGVVIDLTTLKSSTGTVLDQQPRMFYRIEVVLEDTGQTQTQAALSLLDSLWATPAVGGVHGLSVGIKDQQYTYWYASTQFAPLPNTTTLDAASNDFLTKFAVAKRARPTSGVKDVKMDLYVTPNGIYPVINDINWGSFPTLKAGSFTYTQTPSLRYVVLSKLDKGAEPMRFKNLRVVQLVSQVDSVDQVNAHFAKQTVEKWLPQILISPTECSTVNGASNSSNALMLALLYRTYDYYFQTNHQPEIRNLVDTYLQNLPHCVDQAIQAYTQANHTIYDCTKDPNQQLGSVFWANHTYMNHMHWEPRAMYALSEVVSAAQLATFQNAFGPLIDESMQHIQTDGSFPAAGDCFVDDTFAEEISWLLMTYAGFYTLFPNDQPRAAKLLDYLKFLGFIHLSDGRTLNEVYPNVKFTFLDDSYRNFRSRYTYIQTSATAAPHNGYIDNHGFHPSLHYALGIVEAAALARNLLAKRGITTTDMPTIVNNLDLIYRDSVLDYLNLNTLRQARFIPNPRLAWCYQAGPIQQDRYQYNADRSLILFFNGCSTPSGVEDWGTTYVNYDSVAVYGDAATLLALARSVYYNNYAGAGEVFCNAYTGACNTDPLIYTYMLDAVAFGKDSAFTP